MSVITTPQKPKQRLRYFWGIDLAQNLNYCGIVIGSLADNSKTIRYAQIRKFQKVLYPQIITLCASELTRKFPPTKIAVDYTSEKAFSESLEAVYYPSFLNHNSINYKRWRMIEPVVFTPAKKLELKQISLKLHNDRHVDYPDTTKCSAEQAALISELQDQMLRESAEPGTGGMLKFPKPQGFDNDLAIANELMLYVARDYLGTVGASGDIMGFSGGRDDPPTPHNDFMDRTRKRFDSLGTDDYTIDSIS